MKASLQVRLYVAALAVLAAGLLAGAVVYVAATDEAEARPQFEDSRVYRRQLEQFGGKANVLFDQFLRWFDGLWHGRALGLTIGWFGVLVALGLVLLGRFLT